MTGLYLMAAAAVSPEAMNVLAFIDRYFTLILGGGGLAVLGVWLTVRATRQRNTNDYVQGQFTSAEALDKYIDGRIERVAGPLRDELQRLRDRELSTKIILYAYFQRLMWWDERGRIGVMPMPDAEDLVRLGVDLDDFGTTQEHDVVRDAVRRMQSRQADEAATTGPIPTAQNGTPA